MNLSGIVQRAKLEGKGYTKGNQVGMKLRFGAKQS